MTQLNWIAYVGPFKFPHGQAGSQRVHGIARSLVTAGYDVVIGSGESAPVAPVMMEHKEGQGRLSYLGLGELPQASASVIAKSIRWFVTLGERTVQWLDNQSIKPSHVIIYAAHASMVFRILKWCRRNGVSLIIDVVEWYDSWQVLGGPFSPFNISSKTALHILNPKSNGIIAISSYLTAYYQSRGCQALRIPPTINIEDFTFEIPDDLYSRQLITLAYTGIPGKKDRINNVIEALLQLDPEGKRVRFFIAGPNIRDILSLSSLRSRGISELPACIQVFGPQPHEKALELVQKADFMPLLRPDQRYAQAGFPTKVTESMAMGTPLICNLTSDLGEYISDGVEGFVCYDHSVEAFTEALERALIQTPQKRLEMRQAARKRAELSFDYRLYSVELARFLSEKIRRA
jgi:glycosyltransferase involved in cell wall biosynthesis